MSGRPGRVPYCFPMGTWTARGRPGRAAGVAVAGLPRRGRSGCWRPAWSRSRWTRGSRRSSASGSWPASPPPWSSTTRSSSRDLRAAYPDHRGLPRARPMHCTSGTTGTPKGVWSGLLSDDDAAALVAEERSLWGFADTRREPGALAALPLGAAAVRDGHGAGGRPGRRARPVRPGRWSPRRSSGSGRRRCSACRPTCSGCSRTGTRSARRTCRRSGSSRTPARRARTR